MKEKMMEYMLAMASYAMTSSGIRVELFNLAISSYNEEVDDFSVTALPRSTATGPAISTEVIRKAKDTCYGKGGFILNVASM